MSEEMSERWEWQRYRGVNGNMSAEWDSVEIADKPSRSIITGRNSLTIRTDTLDDLILFLQGVRAQIQTRGPDES